ncbi:UNVERIFIED_CONTAM: hypothetical protein NY603_29970, partial [Bacteroidetes bacterium 56_B9]
FTTNNHIQQQQPFSHLPTLPRSLLTHHTLCLPTRNDQADNEPRPFPLNQQTLPLHAANMTVNEAFAPVLSALAIMSSSADKSQKTQA